jgi:cysteine desulfurase
VRRERTLRVYFDNSATTAVDPRVLEEMLPYFTERYGNASSMHSFGREAYNALEGARERVAKAIGASAREIVFTSGGTESDNLALQGAAYANQGKGKHIITSVIEHHAVLSTCHFLEGHGFRVTYLPIDRQGLVDVEKVKEAMSKETILVSIMAANNEIGTIQPIREIGAIVQEVGAVFHTDAVQTITKLPLHVSKDNLQLMAISAHKFHGPKGVGALYVRKDVKLRPLVYGGGQERGLRSSTENVPGIVGLGKALEIGVAEMEESAERMSRIRDRIIEGTLSKVQGSYLNGHRNRRLCNNAHFRFDRVEGEALVLSLDVSGIAASTGSACSTRSTETSHVLRALGIRPEEGRGSLRISLSKFNTMEEADLFLAELPEVVERLRLLVPRGAMTFRASGGG